MHTGMLWFDNSTISLSDKVRKALAYYEKKYGRVPNVVLVHPSAGDAQIDGVTIRHYRPVLPGHIWVGMEEFKEAEPAEAEEPCATDTP